MTIWSCAMTNSSAVRRGVFSNILAWMLIMLTAYICLERATIDRNANEGPDASGKPMTYSAPQSACSAVFHSLDCCGKVNRERSDAHELDARATNTFLGGISAAEMRRQSSARPGENPAYERMRRPQSRHRHDPSHCLPIQLRVAPDSRSD